MCKNCVAIRVYSRISDLECIVDIIKDTWLLGEYDIWVISNGENSGFFVPDKVKNSVFKVVKLANNAGHMSGSSQLLLSLWDNLDFNEYNYCIIIEADTWMYGDDLIWKYIHIMDKFEKVVYAGTKWYDKYYSLATDFGIIKCSYLKDNRGLFLFTDKAECHMANYIINHNYEYVYIKENMLPNLPSYIKKYPYSDGGRLCCFPLSRTVTHHIEHLRGGIKEKKRLFNIVSKTNYFNIERSSLDSIDLIFINVFFFFSKLFLRKTCYSKTIQLEED